MGKKLKTSIFLKRFASCGGNGLLDGIFTYLHKSLKKRWQITRTERENNENETYVIKCDNLKRINV